LRLYSRRESIIPNSPQGEQKKNMFKFIGVTIKACTETVHDLNQVGHSLDATAATLYEAVAQGLAALRAQDWVGEIGKGLTTVTVKVRQPEVTHIVKIQDFENWRNARGKTPAEITLKARLRQILDARQD